MACDILNDMASLTHYSNANLVEPKQFFIKLDISELIAGKLDPAGIYLFKVSNGNTRKICEIFSKLARKTL